MTEGFLKPNAKTAFFKAIFYFLILLEGKQFYVENSSTIHFELALFVTVKLKTFTRFLRH